MRNLSLLEIIIGTCKPQSFHMVWSIDTQLIFNCEPYVEWLCVNSSLQIVIKHDHYSRYHLDNPQEQSIRKFLYDCYEVRNLF